MTNINGKALITLTVGEGEEYCLQYEDNHSVDIINNTDGAIYISSDGVFDSSDGAGHYLTIPEGCGYNGYNHMYMSNKLFVKSNGAGEVCIIIRR